MSENLTYEVTLVVTKEEDDSEPDEWDWTALVDSPYRVVVKDCVQVGIGTTEPLSARELALRDMERGN